MLRLDIYLVENGIVSSRTQAQNLIKSGNVTVNGKTVCKPSVNVDDFDDVICNTDSICPYVSRGGIKLKAAIDAFHVDPSGLICLDVGASTGGFTDCLLKHGAEKVYAVDSGTSQLHSSLLSDKRVVSLENLNARYISHSDIPEMIDLAVMDVSFISQTKLYSSVTSLLKSGGTLISLIKPQFEVGRSGIGKGGIVKDQKKRLDAVNSVIETAASFGLINRGIINSPIEGGDGNHEYLACFSYKGEPDEN